MSITKRIATAERIETPFERFKPFLAGEGWLDQHGDSLRMSIPPTPPRRYADAQIDDYHGLKRSRFPWKPPLRLVVRARASHPEAHPFLHTSTLPHSSQIPRAVPAGHTPILPNSLIGTAGFGFWNDPFTLTGGGVVAAPNVVWFFYASPPSDMALVEGVPGWGWKAATINCARIPTLALAPAAAAAVLLTKVPGLGRPVMAAARRAMRISERLAPADLDEWHEYQIEWREAEAVFRIDGNEILRAPDPPRGPLGFVAWIDNQYAVATPEGRFGFGLVETRVTQWLEMERLSLVPLGPAEVG